MIKQKEDLSDYWKSLKTSLKVNNKLQHSYAFSPLQSPYSYLNNNIPASCLQFDFLQYFS